MKFAIEKISDTWDEAHDLMLENHKETGSTDSIEFNPDKDKYLAIENVGLMKLFTARDEGKLVGYAIFLISVHLHYSCQLWAMQDVMFMKNTHRGIGSYRFMKWVDEELANLGVNVVLRSVHVRKDYSRILEKIGYQKIETSFMRRFN